MPGKKLKICKSNNIPEFSASYGSKKLITITVAVWFEPLKARVSFANRCFLAAVPNPECPSPKAGFQSICHRLLEIDYLLVVPNCRNLFQNRLL
jgi:hypothetical protein